MNKVIIYVVLLAIVIQSTSQIWIITSFYIQRQYIVKNLCVNRFDATSTCHGHCYLTKQLKENEKKQQLPELKSKQMDWLMPHTLKVCFISIPIIPSKKINTKEFIFISSDFIFSIFHPPQVVYFLSK